MSVNNVRFQWTSLSKPSTTGVTGKGFLACMDYHVSFEYWRFLEEFAAKLTSVPLGIRSIVDLQSKKKVLGIFGFVLTIFLLDSKCCTLSFTPWILKIISKTTFFNSKDLVDPMEAEAIWEVLEVPAVPELTEDFGVAADFAHEHVIAAFALKIAVVGQLLNASLPYGISFWLSLGISASRRYIHKAFLRYALSNVASNYSFAWILSCNIHRRRASLRCVCAHVVANQKGNWSLWSKSSRCTSWNPQPFPPKQP